jgi:hypothetical protein
MSTIMMNFKNPNFLGRKFSRRFVFQHHGGLGGGLIAGIKKPPGGGLKPIIVLLVLVPR